MLRGHANSRATTDAAGGWQKDEGAFQALLAELTEDGLIDVETLGCSKSTRSGPHLLIQFFLERLGMTRILDKHLYTNRDLVLSHGAAISVLVHNVLVSRDSFFDVGHSSL